ncbi:CRISPR system precrRNA processing endoribonuclease RAMP protein Cas6 [Fodinisporobacter ferrooxydans]|uniref:CRISPR system precrRNA processing endoribonuclease RAMP protein Cas6 n=1 Tax=Fodinisporobacter ferrooxydans TaxID=2901836 RepID=A0ABY4CX79_9BACL|nr:CRISPR system precrRNA processing endoribonuclease RAMP protein Cas6 [Alicyclobacillaceae bacterium MYW30-H2]
MLQELELNFSVLHDHRRNGNINEAIHGWLFHRLKVTSPSLADQIHNMRIKPFAIDAISKKGTVLTSGKRISASICIFSPQYSHSISDSLTHALGKDYEIGRVGVKFDQMSVKRKQTYEQLIEESFSRDYEQVQVTFVSPTSFRREGVQILYPSPELVLQSLHNRWKEFCPVKTTNMDTKWEERFVVSRYQLQTKLVVFDKYPIVGCVGNIQYTRSKHANYYQDKLAHALFQFGTYSGVGYKTTMGLGRMHVAF